MISTKRRKLPQLSDFPEEEVTPAVLMLLEICHLQREEIRALRDEFARLKGQKPKPSIRPSKLRDSNQKKRGRQQGGQGKPSKTSRLKSRETVRIRPDDLPNGSRFKGYQDFTVQDIRIELHNTCYRLERWATPSGEAIVGQLPSEVDGHHFGATLRTDILYQYYPAHVTQPLLLEQLREWGIQISTGEISTIITAGKAAFHAEKEALLQVDLQGSGYAHVDDTRARHQGKNGYCTHIGNEQFAYFASTDGKRRINFPSLPRAGHEDYVVNAAALAYRQHQKLPKAPLTRLTDQLPGTLGSQARWLAHLAELSITTPRQVRIATEGALLGSAVEHGVHPDLVSISEGGSVRRVAARLGLDPCRTSIFQTPRLQRRTAGSLGRDP